MRRICSLCGVREGDGHSIQFAHVRGKASFTEGEIASKYDRMQNIIPLCVGHHQLFDVARGLAVVDLDQDRDLFFARWNCCCEGVCIREPVNDTFRNLFQISKGIPGDKVKPDYIELKNREILIAELYRFAQDPDGMVYRECTETFMN